MRMLSPHLKDEGSPWLHDLGVPGWPAVAHQLDLLHRSIHSQRLGRIISCSDASRGNGRREGEKVGCGGGWQSRHHTVVL